MGKVTVVKSSKKETKCSKCGVVLPVGSMLLKGLINFHPAIVRCPKCGLQEWEVTTSSYQLAVGEVVYNWDKDLTPQDINYTRVEDIIEELTSIREELEGNLDNLPEQFRDTESGALLQERIETLDNAISDLESIDDDFIKEETLNYLEIESDIEDIDWSKDEAVIDTYSDLLAQAINEALSVIEV